MLPVTASPKFQPHSRRHQYHGGISLLGSIVLYMIRSGKHEEDRVLVIGFMSELSTQPSVTRASLVMYAAIAAKGYASLKRLAAKSAVSTIKRLSDVL